MTTFLPAITGPVWDIIKCMCTSVGHQIQYARRLDEKIKKLERDAQYIVNRRNDIKEELKGVGKVSTEVCKNWLDDVEKIEQEISEIKDEFAQNKKCISGLFPNVTWRLSLGKHVKRVVVRCGELQEKSKFEGGFVLDAPPPAVEFLQLPMTVDQVPINRTLQKLMGYIRNEKFHMIGIWGMGGVGKTTVMKALNNLREISTTFEIVIWVTVSSQGSVERIQKDVGKRLSFDVKDADLVQTVAHKIHQSLSSKKFLLLLDDVWQSLDLGVIGIPNPKEPEKGSKVVLTTRDQMVGSYMDIDEIVKVDCLSKEEAWNLFAHKVGGVVNNRSINPYAKDAVEECDGLPLAIIVLGATLRNIDHDHVWCNKLRELQSSTSSSIGSMEDRVFKPLRFSYDQLGDDNIKQCFLYCALYPEDDEMEVNKLIEYWRAEGLTDDARTIIDVHSKGYDILNTLIQKSLLEMAKMENGKWSHCRMHDVLRDLALRITSPKGNNDSKFLVRAGLRGKSLPKEEEWKQMERISFRESNLCTLPKSPKCITLETLLLNNNRGLKTIPDLFFQYMTQLRVLDLSDTSITSLPSCISSLTNLRGLYLNSCDRLAVLPSEVGSLKKLEALHMVEVGVKILPDEIGNLNCLMSLLVSSSIETVIIPVGVIKRLISLEQLAIGVAMKNESWVASIDKTLGEVASLKNLTKIQLQFPKVGHLERFLSSSWFWKEQRSLNFRFYVDDYVRRYFVDPQLERIYGFFKCTYNADSSTSTLSSHVITSVLRRCQEFSINGHRGIKRLSEFGMQNIEALKICIVAVCGELEILANGDESEGDLLPNLEFLRLQSLPKLRKIVEGQVSTRSFSNLRSLALLSCRRIKHMFSWSMIKQLANLESLSIITCHGLEDIFEENEIEPEILRNDDHQLPNLKFLKLCGLPKLVSVDKIVRLALSSIEEISIDICNVKSLPRSLVDAPKLKRIGGKREWWYEKLEWEDNTIKQRFQPVFFVE